MVEGCRSNNGVSITAFAASHSLSIRKVGVTVKYKLMVNGVWRCHVKETTEQMKIFHNQVPKSNHKPEIKDSNHKPTKK